MSGFKQNVLFYRRKLSVKVVTEEDEVLLSEFFVLVFHADQDGLDDCKYFRMNELDVYVC